MIVNIASRSTKWLAQRLHCSKRISGGRGVHSSPLAFALDIDGVLIRGSQVIPAAKRALAMLHGNNSLGMQIPYILLTNGGGVSEEERARRLTRMLDVEIKPHRYIQAHTVLKTIAHKYTDTPVLVLGGKGDGVRQIAESYGFNLAFTTLDVLSWNPLVWPFHQLTPEEKSTVKATNFSHTPLSAIFVFHDPRNWALDIQVMCDVIRSGGIIGGPYKSADRQVELIFCNPDLLWGTNFQHPRLGQGGFITAFQAVYKALTNSPYPYIQYGKPTRATYQFAEVALTDCVAETYGTRCSPQIYMIGDNPESDIAGANAANWNSILVRTGVFDPRYGPPRHSPTHEVEDVEEAVRWAIDREIQRLRR